MFGIQIEDIVNVVITPLAFLDKYVVTYEFHLIDGRVFVCSKNDSAVSEKSTNPHLEYSDFELEQICKRLHRLTAQALATDKPICIEVSARDKKATALYLKDHPVNVPKGTTIH